MWALRLDELGGVRTGAVPAWFKQTSKCRVELGVAIRPYPDRGEVDRCQVGPMGLRDVVHDIRRFGAGASPCSFRTFATVAR